jgi:hypothetical protein
MGFSWRSGRFQKPRNCMCEIIIEVQKSLTDFQVFGEKSFKRLSYVVLNNVLITEN